jgi:hypothetical protein
MPVVIYLIFTLIAWPSFAADTINVTQESSTTKVKICFFDDAHVPVSPGVLRYALYDGLAALPSALLVAETRVDNPGTCYTWYIDAALNARGRNKAQRPHGMQRTIEFAWDWGAGFHSTKSVTYPVQLHTFEPPQPAGPAPTATP